MAIVQFVDVSGQQAINAATQGLPTSKTIVYGLWFYNSRSQAKLIGGFDQTDNKGHLVLQGQLPKGVDIASYKDLVDHPREAEHEPDVARARSTCAGRSRTPPAASPTAAACRGS